MEGIFLIDIMRILDSIEIIMKFYIREVVIRL